MAKIAFNDLPAWAQTEIRKCGSDGMTNSFIGGHTLSVGKGTAVFDGRLVAEPGEDANAPEETTEFAELPAWAQAEYRKWQFGAVMQCNRGSNTLQITALGSALFDGKRVNKTR